MQFQAVDRQKQCGLIAAALLLLAGLILRAATFGDPNIHVDETFYLQVGEAMHHGAVPYIDVWDRKPLGIFIIYWAIAGISINPWCYQLIALGFAIATAWRLMTIARLWSSQAAALMAGVSYLAMLNVFEGMGGQSPVFYNLLTAQAAFLILSSWRAADPRRFIRAHLFAMVLVGLNLTIKQTTLFEGLFFGLVGIFWLQRQSVAKIAILRHGALAVALAMLPTALIAAWYAGHGWWAEWFHAMVTSNLRRQGIGEGAVIHNLIAIGWLLVVFVGIAAVGLTARWQDEALRPFRTFMLLWLAVAFGSLAAVPNFFSHYVLPLLVPLTPLTALGFERKPIGLILFAINLIVASILGTTFDFKTHRQSRQAFEDMTATILRYRNGGRVLILNGPPLLYTVTDSKPMSPLVFPEHLINGLETDVSPFRTKPEIERMIAARPTIVMVPAIYVRPPTDGRMETINGYLAANCRIAWQGNFWEPRAVKRSEIIFACKR